MNLNLDCSTVMEESVLYQENRIPHILEFVHVTRHLLKFQDSAVCKSGSY